MTTQYGIKGTMAYFAHAENIKKVNPAAFTDSDREDVFGQLFKAYADIAPEKVELGDMLGAALGVGATNLKVMELLDGAHTGTSPVLYWILYNPIANLCP